jgi:hypothetical protein
MSTDDLKNEIRQLMMFISSIRSQDNDRFEQHVQYMNEVVSFIKKIQDNMNTNWDKIHKSLDGLNKTVESSLDALLTGINPEGLRETSQSLKEIMDTMGKSIQSMNLENVMRELRGLTGEGLHFEGGKPADSGSKATPLKAGLSAPYSGGKGGKEAKEADNPAVEGLSEAEIKAYKDAYGGVLPPHLQKQTKKKESHLLKPSDFFGS